MQKCSICEKPIYGHPQTTKKLVCGSCPLKKMDGGGKGKSFAEVRLDLAKLVTRPIPDVLEGPMSNLKVKSNVRNKTILLDGRIPLVFDADGFGKLPAHHLSLLEVTMRMHPGRYSIVRDTVAAPVVEAVVVPTQVEPVVEPVVSVVENKAEETFPAEFDLEFLTDEEQEKPKKKASKK